ncbi:hypothetical protein V8F33_009349 [Rhypophila sp. PSN 637]
MSTRVLRDRRRFQYQNPAGLELETQLSPLSPYNTRKRKRDQIGTDSGYQTEDSSYDDQETEPRRPRTRKDSVTYRTEYSPTSSWYSSSPSTPSVPSSSESPISKRPKEQHTPAQPQTPQEVPPRPAVRGHGLILTFKDTDLPPVVDDISSALNSIQCSSQTIHMDSPEFSTSFQEFLDLDSPQPRIVYINSHGQGDVHDKLELCSHGPENTGVTLPWSKIQHPISITHSNVLVILTSCHGGLAKITNEADPKFAKELITTASWAESTFAYLGSAAMSIALNRWYWASAELTGWALYEALTRVIKEIREDEIRRGHGKISVLEDQVGSVRGEVERLESELQGLERGARVSSTGRKATASKGPWKKYRDSGKVSKSQSQSPERDLEDCPRAREKEKLEKMIRKQKRILREVMEEKIDEEEILQENRNHYTQPHFMRAEVRMLAKGPPAWSL